MSPSTRRALRTVYQGVLAALVVVPILAAALAGTGVAELAKVAGVLVLAVGVVSKAVNALEDARMIPAWLKREPDAPETPGDAGRMGVVLLVVVGLAAAVALLIGPSVGGAVNGDPADTSSKAWL